VDLRTIGEQLGVRTVLEGSVRRVGQRVRISAQLINVADGYNLWSERYDREIEDVFAVQDEIASAIAQRMKTTLGRHHATTVEQRSTENIEAYEAYLKGRSFLYRRGAATKEGIALMERAISLDPTYGPAWAGLADAYTVLGYSAQVRIEQANAKAHEAANRALAFAPDLAEAHAARAMVSLIFDWDFDAADRSFARAIELNPRYLQGVAWYFLFLLGFVRQQWDAAIAGLLELEQLEPMSAYVAAVLADAYANRGDHSDALRSSERAMQLESSAFLSVFVRQLIHHERGEWTKAIEAAETVLASSGRHIWSLFVLSCSHAMNGELEEARAVYGEMAARSKREPISPMALAVAAAHLGDTPLAIDYAREAIRRHDPMVATWSLGWRTTLPLRSIPEVRLMLAEIGLVDAAHVANELALQGDTG
jgi:tetratricopeptide (TPR) repeat protein